MLRGVLRPSQTSSSRKNHSRALARECFLRLREVRPDHSEQRRGTGRVRAPVRRTRFPESPSPKSQRDFGLGILGTVKR